MRTLLAILFATLFSLSCRAQAQSVLADPIAFYRHAISPLRGTPCSMHPSCSAYGEQCFSRYNFLHAAALTADRLTRCGHAHSRYLWHTPSDGLARLIDPAPFRPIPYHLADWPTLPFFAPARRKRSPESLIAQLVNQGLHAQALAEFERLALFAPHLLSHHGYADALRCYMALDRVQDGIAFHHARIPAPIRKRPVVARQLAKLYILADNSPLAQGCIASALQAPISPADRRALHLLEALSYLPFTAPGQANYPQALRALALAKPDAPDSTTYAKSFSLLRNLDRYRPQSPPLAASLSIVPGLGYLYLGHWATGVTSLLLNGALAMATYQAIRAEQWALAGIIGMLNISFYIGGIQGAYRRARLDAQTYYQTAVNQLRYMSNFQNL